MVRIEGAPRAAAETLGDLLYADETRTRVPETEWVELVRAIASGEQKALQCLYARTHRIVFTLMVRLVNDRPTAEELTLDVFHDVWRGARRYDPSAGTVVGWIMNQARCRGIDRLRLEQRKKRTKPHAQYADTESTPGGQKPLSSKSSAAVL